MGRQGIKRSRTTKDGQVHVWYRYPVTEIYDGEYCPLCMQKNEVQDFHHVVPRIETRIKHGYAQHWHNNIINICTLCHEKINRNTTQSVLIRKRTHYFMNSVYGLRTWKNREFFRKVCESANEFKRTANDKYAFISYLFMIENQFKYMSIAHYHASFGEKYANIINDVSTPFFFLEASERAALNKSLPTPLALDAAAAARLQSLFLAEDNNPALIRGTTRRAQ